MGVWLWILSQCLVCRPECPTMHGKGMRNIISYPSRKVSVFGLYGRKNRLRHYLSMLIGLIPIPNKDMQQAVPLLSFSVYYINYMVLHRITYTFFHLFLASSLFRSIFFIINLCITPNYTVLHSITSYIALSIPKLYISLFWYLKYWKCRSCINFISK